MSIDMNKKLFEAVNDFTAKTGIYPYLVRMNENTLKEIQKHFEYEPRGFSGKFGVHLYGMSVEEDKRIRNGFISIIYSDDTYMKKEELMERVIKYKGYRLY